MVFHIWYLKSLKTEIAVNNYKNSGRTSQETHYVPATRTNRLILFREKIALHSLNHTKHTDTFCGQNAEF
jgi:hypothetical protein